MADNKTAPDSDWWWNETEASIRGAADCARLLESRARCRGRSPRADRDACLYLANAHAEAAFAYEEALRKRERRNG